MNSPRRIKYMSDLAKFIDQASINLTKFCDGIGWNTNASVDNKEKLVQCTVDSGHCIPLSKIASHTEKCQLAKKGYSKEDVLFPESCTDGGPVITLTQESQAQITQSISSKDPRSISSASLESPPDIPQSAARLVSSFSVQQRLALYEYAVEQTASKRREPFTLTESDLAFEHYQPRNKDQKEKSHLEVLAEQRNAKRRRLKYREMKKVHTKNKSQTEVTREVIANQMELYTEWLNESEASSSHIEKEASVFRDNEHTDSQRERKHEPERYENKFWSNRTSVDKKNSSLEFQEGRTSRSREDVHYRHSPPRKYKELEYDDFKLSRGHDQHRSHHHKSHKSHHTEGKVNYDSSKRSHKSRHRDYEDSRNKTNSRGDGYNKRGADNYSKKKHKRRRGHSSSSE